MGVKKSKTKKKCRLIAGADPGKDGAIVLLNKDNGKIVKMFRVPKIVGKRKSNEPDWHAFDDFVKKYAKRIEHFFLEKPNTGGGFAGRTQSIELGKSIKAFEQTCIANALRFTMIAPTKWQKVMFEGVPIIDYPRPETKEQKEKRVSENKERKRERKKARPVPKVKDNKAMALEACKRLFPKKSFVPEGANKPFDGWTDASLIGLYGLWQINGKG